MAVVDRIGNIRVSLRRIYDSLNVAGDNKTYVGLHPKCQILTKYVFARQIFIKVPNFTALIHGQTDDLTVGHDEDVRRLSRLSEHT